MATQYHNVLKQRLFKDDRVDLHPQPLLPLVLCRCKAASPRLHAAFASCRHRRHSHSSGIAHNRAIQSLPPFPPSRCSFSDDAFSHPPSSSAWAAVEPTAGFKRTDFHSPRDFRFFDSVIIAEKSQKTKTCMSALGPQRIFEAKCCRKNISNLVHVSTNG